MNWTMRKKISIALGICFLGAGSLIHSQEEESQPLSEEVQYEVKEKLDIQKIPPTIELDIKEIVESGTAQTEDVLEEARPVPSEEDFNHYAFLDSNQVTKPWARLLPEPPLVTFYPGLSKVASKRWEFKVSDQTGEVIKVIKGNGVPPRQFNWNGLDGRGKYINVGTLYSYQFITYDEHANAHTFPGEPFELDALKYHQKKKMFIEFSNPKLFLEDQAVIRPSMKGLWERALDAVRKNSNMPLNVEMFAQSVKNPLAEERRQVIVNAISDATNIPAVDIRHSVQKLGERGDVIRLVMKAK